MSLRDITASAFIFIMGFLFGYVFQKHRNRFGLFRATGFQVYRYGLILILGLLVSFLESGSLFRTRSLPGGETITVVIWDVLHTIGLVGLVGIPFLFLSPKYRFPAGYLMIAFYQIMLCNDSTGWKLYTIKSIHGGVLGACFAFSGQLIIASALGEYFFSKCGEGQKKDLP